jgi:transcriptional regulator with XRE-family HTH domain
MDIGKRIRDLREERGLTQREVARRAGLTPSGVGFIEHGQTRKPSAETVVAIARALGVPVKELLEEPVPLDEASQTGPDIARRARGEALRQWERGHKAIARAIADAFGFSVADLVEEPPASLAEAPRETGQLDLEKAAALREWLSNVRKAAQPIMEQDDQTIAAYRQALARMKGGIGVSDAYFVEEESPEQAKLEAEALDFLLAKEEQRRREMARSR